MDWDGNNGTSILRQVGDGVNEIPIEADGTTNQSLLYQNEASMTLQLTPIENGIIFAHVNPDQNCDDTLHPRPKGSGSNNYTPIQILSPQGINGNSAVYENIQFYHGETPCGSSDLVPYDDIKKIIITNVDLVGGTTNTNYLGSKKINITYVFSDDFVIPEFNNITSLDQDQQLSYSSDNGCTELDMFDDWSGIPRYKANVMFVLPGIEESAMVLNPVKINIGLKCLNGDSSYTDVPYTTVGAYPVGDLRVSPNSDHTNQILTDAYGLYGCSDCNTNSKYPELQSTSLTAEYGVGGGISRLDNINSSVGIEEFDIVSDYPCRTVRLAVPSGATVANGEMPSEVKLRLSLSQAAYGGSGYLIYYSGFSQVSFPQNTDTVESQFNINPYAITNSQQVNLLQQNGINDAMSVVTGSSSLVDTTAQIDILEISDTEYEITIPIDPNFTAPASGCDINVVVPYVAYTGCRDALGNPVPC
jgi:hypothetical protein